MRLYLFLSNCLPSALCLFCLWGSDLCRSHLNWSCSSLILHGELKRYRECGGFEGSVASRSGPRRQVAAEPGHPDHDGIGNPALHAPDPEQHEGRPLAHQDVREERADRDHAQGDRQVTERRPRCPCSDNGGQATADERQHGEKGAYPAALPGGNADAERPGTHGGHDQRNSDQRRSPSWEHAAPASTSTPAAIIVRLKIVAEGWRTIAAGGSVPPRSLISLPPVV